MNLAMNAAPMAAQMNKPEMKFAGKGHAAPMAAPMNAAAPMAHTQSAEPKFGKAMNGQPKFGTGQQLNKMA